MKKSFFNNFLKELCREYTSLHGASISRLSDWYFSFTIVDGNSTLMGILVDEYPNESFGEGLELIFDELLLRGYIEGVVGRYTLTEKGLTAGTQSRISKILSFFNFNSGLNTIIAILSLIISAIALYISTTNT